MQHRDVKRGTVAVGIWASERDREAAHACGKLTAKATGIWRRDAQTTNAAAASEARTDDISTSATLQAASRS